MSKAFAVLVLICSTPAAIAGQLRPLEPLDWGALDANAGAISVAASVASNQRASHAGTEGRLYEFGVYSALARFDRVSIQVNGAVVRLFFDRSVFTSPSGGAEPDDDGRRVDTGDHQIHTVVRLGPASGPIGTALRFGVRLPTTNHVTGLERDRTDFVATLAGRFRRGGWIATGELGIGIHGSRDPSVEQIDPILYAFSVRYLLRGVIVRADVLGQHDTRSGVATGGEDLSEVRIGAEMGSARFVRVATFAGLTDFSPNFGVTVMSGVRF